GRERELAELGGLLATHPLGALTGGGGTGKTRLALQAAAAALPAHPRGARLVAPAAPRAPAPGAPTGAPPPGVRAGRERPPQATLTDALRPKRVLLVLDNCEHLLDACARLADALLRACPRLTILATSREALGIAGETAWPVPSLSLPDPQHAPAAEPMTRYEA